MNAAAELVKHFEGLRLKPYVCPAGFWTVGYGHLCQADQPVIDEAQADAWLESDMAGSRAAVLKLITPHLTDNQLGALTSWTFNMGSGRLRSSTMRAVLNRGEFGRVPVEMGKWVFGGGRKLPGLVARREAEIILWRAA